MEKINNSVKIPKNKLFQKTSLLLFNLFLQLFMSLIVLFGTIYGSHCTILTNFYLYLQNFPPKKKKF